MTERFLAATGNADVPALFEALSRGRLRVPSGLAPTLDMAAAEGDDVATSILVGVGRAHGVVVAGIARRLAIDSMAFELVRSGGVHRSSTALFGPAFVDAVLTDCPLAAMTMLVAPPVLGAIELAQELIGRPASVDGISRPS